MCEKASANSGQILVGEVIAVFVGEDDDWKNVAVPAGSGAKPAAASAPLSSAASFAKAPAASSPQQPQQVAVSKPIVEKKGITGSTAPLSPAVAHLVELHHLDAGSIPATGPKNRILKGDVLQFLQENPSAKEKATTTEAPKAVAPKKPVQTAANVRISS